MLGAAQEALSVKCIKASWKSAGLFPSSLQHELLQAHPQVLTPQRSQSAPVSAAAAAAPAAAAASAPAAVDPDSLIGRNGQVRTSGLVLTSPVVMAAIVLTEQKKADKLAAKAAGAKRKLVLDSLPSKQARAGQARNAAAAVAEEEKENAPPPAVVSAAKPASRAHSRKRGNDFQPVALSPPRFRLVSQIPGRLLLLRRV